MSTFTGLSSALTALHAHRRGMETAAHNIANVNTPGYSRQKADLKAIGGLSVTGLVAQAVPVGNGVRVESIQRLRDTFLETRGRIEHAHGEYLTGQRQLLDRVEQAFAEPSDTALQSQLTELWSAFGDLSNRPSETAARTAVLARANIVADTMRSTAGQLSSVWDTTREHLNSVVTEINYTAVAVAELNQSIIASTATGQPANDLADQRDVLVMKLAELTGSRATSNPDGSVDVQINGAALVVGTSSRQLAQPIGATSLADVQGGQRVTLRFVDNSIAVVAPSGKLASSVESLNGTLRGYADRLDGVARNLVSAVNEQHALGLKDNGQPGGLFFGPDADPDPTVVTASNIHVEISATTDIAAAGADAAPGSKDGTNADALADLVKKDDGPDRMYRQLVVDLGVETQSIKRRSDIQNSVVTQVDAARTGESGVNLDEEMTNLVAFERAYQAAAKVISTIDEMLDTLINRMGL